ncbi:flavodoxin [Anaerovibrio sp.]|uniref:flavodoxin n=1 Tax=Anaerovibrio sp. TaxID=1872532 RepID=UPI003F17E9D7
MIRRMFLILVAVLAVLLAAGCGTSQSAAPKAENSGIRTASADNRQTGDTVPAGGNGKRILVVYFSWSGNSAAMAEYVQQQTGGDLLELQPLMPYPQEYEECTRVARAERDEGRLPEIANLPADIGSYDTILLGYPIWWHTAPMIIGTFLQHYDLTGVDVYPFVQSTAMEQVHFDNSMEFVRKYSRGAVVHEGLYAKHGNRAKISQWLKENNLLAGQ